MKRFFLFYGYFFL